MSKYYHSLARPQSGSGPAVSHSESTSSNNSTSLYAHPASFRSLATSSAAEDPKHLSGSSSFLGSHTAGPSTSTSTSSNSHSHPNTASSSRLPSQRQGPFPGLLSDPPPAPYSFHQQTASPTTATNDFFAHQQQQHQHQQSARHTAHFQTSDQRPTSSSSVVSDSSSIPSNYPYPTPPPPPQAYALGPMNPAAALLAGSGPSHSLPPPPLPQARPPPVSTSNPLSNSPPPPHHRAALGLGFVPSRAASDSPPQQVARPMPSSGSLRLTSPRSQDPMVSELKRIRNKESSQRFRDRTKERQREKDQRLDYLENKVFELEGALAETGVIREENRVLKMRIGELERQLRGDHHRPLFYQQQQQQPS